MWWNDSEPGMSGLHETTPWSLVSSRFIQVHLWVPIHWNVSKIIHHWQIRLPTWYPLCATPINFNGGIMDQSIPRSSTWWCELLVLPCWIDNFVSRRSISKELKGSQPAEHVWTWRRWRSRWPPFRVNLENEANTMFFPSLLLFFRLGAHTRSGSHPWPIKEVGPGPWKLFGLRVRIPWWACACLIVDMQDWSQECLVSLYR